MTVTASGVVVGTGPDQDVHGRDIKMLGRARGRENRSDTGYAYLHEAVDDHSRLSYGETLAERRTGGAPQWRHHYNHHRFHTAIGGPPAFRGTNPQVSTCPVAP